MPGMSALTLRPLHQLTELDCDTKSPPEENKDYDIHSTCHCKTDNPQIMYIFEPTPESDSLHCADINLMHLAVEKSHMRSIGFAVVLRCGTVLFARPDFDCHTDCDCESCNIPTSCYRKTTCCHYFKMNDLKRGEEDHNFVSSKQFKQILKNTTFEFNKENLHSSGNEKTELKNAFNYQGLMSHMSLKPLCGRKPLKKGKLSRKKQRHKRLLEVVGMNYMFHFCFVVPAHLTVYPVQRQIQGKKINGSDSPKDQIPPLKAPDSAQWPPEQVRCVPWATFCQELYRLGTFSDIPSNVSCFAVRLAEAGFLLLENNTIVCFFCHFQFQQNMWTAGKFPLEVHRSESPYCPMITGVDCGNKPVQTCPSEQLEHLLKVWSLSGPLLFTSSGRVPPEGKETKASAAVPPVLSQQVLLEPHHGRDRPLDISEDGSSGASSGTGNRLAASQTQSRDQSRTQGSQQQPRTGLIGGNPASGSSARSTFLDGTTQAEQPGARAGTEGAPANVSRAGQQVVTYQQLGIITESPKRADMAMINSRVGTFRNWPSSSSHTPLQLAEAGFFYAGYADCGRCFFCNGGLKSWEPTDDPWVEHARWFPKCAYVRQFQGQDFVDLVQELHASATGQKVSLNQVRAEIQKRRADGEHIQEPLMDVARASAEDLGYRHEVVDIAAEAVLREGNHLTVDKLFDRLVTNGVQPTAAVSPDVPAVTLSELAKMPELVTENSELRQQRMCKICLDKEVCIVFLPCGHLVCCAECSPALQQCPMCRQKVKGRVRCFPG